MSFLTAQPEALAAAADILHSIGTETVATNAAAAAPTTGVVPAAADEVSMLSAAHFATHAVRYQTAASRAAVIYDRFVATLASSAGSYAITEAVNAAAAK